MVLRSLCLLLAWAGDASGATDRIILENPHVHYALSPDGKNLEFIDLASGTNYLKPGAPSPCALIRCNGKDHPATTANLSNDRLTLGFGDAGVQAVLKVETRPSALLVQVDSTTGPALESLTFLNVPLTLKGKPAEPFGACAVALTLATRVDQLPALQTELRASCSAKFGIVGAKVAIVGAPTTDMLAALKEVISDADELPPCRVAGPWAQDIPFNHGSYVFNLGSLTEATTDEWIAATKSLGFSQIDNHGGSSFFRFGDFELNRTKWPEGWETYRRIVARLHAAGIGSIFHTYAFFIDKQSKYVTPVPDPRLDAFRTFTLAESISPDADEIRVTESTEGLSTVTGFFVHNSVVLHIGNELVTFGGASSSPPWRFTGVKRAALGTQRAPHSKGDQARHLKECFDLLVPNPESSLFEEIAANHAEIVNQCDFDALYLDAIDGAPILRGPDESWYWASKFVSDIQKRLRKPAGMEMSAMWHHFWRYRTRWQAWDYPRRGYERFIDLHAEAVNGGLLLPLHLGWWSIESFNPPQVEPTYPDTLEYLGAKLVGWDAGISLAGAFEPGRLRSEPLYRRAADTLRACEELRHSGAFDATAKAQLREPGKEFHLTTNQAGALRFCRAQSTRHVAALAEPWTLSWRITNAFAAQPLKLRIEALMSAPDYDDPRAILVADSPDTRGTNWKTSAAVGVSQRVEGRGSDSEIANRKSQIAIREWSATNSAKLPRTAAWARLERQFSPPINLKDHEALAIEVQGDGLGELLAIRLESPRPLAYGAIADRYLPVDFTGRRLLTLIETESSRWSDYVWNDGKGPYNAYRESVDAGVVESVSFWYQNLPTNQEVRCRIGPLKAVPMLPCAVKNPAISINGVTLVFPVGMTSGSWLECNGPDDCAVFGAKGELLGKVAPRGDYPNTQPGESLAQFSCAPSPGASPRVAVTVFSRGETL